jgi:hypothetical protein
MIPGFRQVLLDQTADERQVDRRRAKDRDPKFFDRLRLRIRSKTDWFEVDGELQVDDHLVLDMKRLLELLETTKTRFIPLQEGQFLALTQELRKRLLDLEVYAAAKGAAAASLAARRRVSSAPVGSRPGLEDTLDAIDRAVTGTEVPPSSRTPGLPGGGLPVVRLAHLGLGNMDDIGLGKTLQALAIMLERAPGGPRSGCLTLVCMNWVSKPSFLLSTSCSRERTASSWLNWAMGRWPPAGLLYQKRNLAPVPADYRAGRSR